MAVLDRTIGCGTHAAYGENMNGGLPTSPRRAGGPVKPGQEWPPFNPAPARPETSARDTLKSLNKDKESDYV